MTTTHLTEPFTEPVTEPISARAILFGSDDDAVASLTHTLASGGIADVLDSALATFTEATRTAAVQELSRVASGLLAVSLGEVVVKAWRTHATILSAAQRTAGSPLSRELVEVATHDISWAQQPYVQLLVDGVRVATVHLELALDLEVQGLVVAIAGGRLTAVHSGSCEAAASLSAEGRSLARRAAHVELPLVLHLGDGIPLLGPEDPSRPSL
ncbi:MAG TPA: hypothetical protein VFN43_05580 [Humibacillus sp.]|nr:hypothetical protein [Humibacillus sp.]